MSLLCGCIRCVESRIMSNSINTAFHMTFAGPSVPGWRYTCELCGNKQCPHHTDHRLSCTKSNELGQVGSDY